MKILGIGGAVCALALGAIVSCNGGTLTPTQKAVGAVLCQHGQDFLDRSANPSDPLVREGAALACGLFAAIPVQSGPVTDEPLTQQQSFCSSFSPLPGAGPAVAAYNAEYDRQCVPNG